MTGGDFHLTSFSYASIPKIYICLSGAYCFNLFKFGLNKPLLFRMALIL